MQFKLLMREQTVPNIRKRNDISATDTSLQFEMICISKHKKLLLLKWTLAIYLHVIFYKKGHFILLYMTWHTLKQRDRRPLSSTSQDDVASRCLRCGQWWPNSLRISLSHTERRTSERRFAASPPRRTRWNDRLADDTLSISPARRGSRRT
jgi:hypothetical protein